MWDWEQGAENVSQFSHQGAMVAAAGWGVLDKMIKSLGHIESEGSRASGS